MPKAGLILLGALAFAACSDSGTPPGPVVAAIDLAAPATYLEKDATLQLAATPRDAQGGTVTTTVSWTSDATTVARVDGTGLVTGVAAGTARITASAGGKSESVDLAVRDNAPLGSNLSGRIERVKILLPQGQTFTATADLELVADEELRIDGTLLIASDAAVTLGSYTRTIITGNVVPATPSVRATSARVDLAPPPPPKDAVVWGPTIDLGPQTNSATIQSTGNLFIGGIPGPNGAPVVTLTNVDIQGSKGQPGTSSNRDGGPGGDIEIGTVGARTAAAAAAKRAAQPFSSIRVVGTVYAEGGFGGKSYSILTRADAVSAGNTLTAVGGKGGNGGSVGFEATNTVDFSGAVNATLRGGGGARGGSVVLTGLEKLRDGSGPNEEGESFIATSGDGGEGGSVTVDAPNVGPNGFAGRVEAGAGGSGGDVATGGGNGKNGGRGGDFTIRVGVPGAGGLATLGTARLPDPPRAQESVVQFVFPAMNGGAGHTNQTGGGTGGALVVTDPVGGVAFITAVSGFEDLANGGPGFNGCAVVPITNGTAGGLGGTLNAPGRALAAGGSKKFDGGSGGDGNGPGAGGDQGRDVVLNQPIGNKGADGQQCPATFVSADKTSFTFTHHVGVTQCPQSIGPVTISNTSGGQVTVTVTTPGTNSIALSTQQFVMGPGGSLQLNVFFNCNRTTSFTGTVRFSATDGTTTQTLDLPVTGTVQ